MNEIHPTAIIGDDVRLGDGNLIGPFAIITGDVRMGDDNWIGAGVVIGAHPEVRSFEHSRERHGGEGSGIVIGSGNVIREYAQVHQGLTKPTRIGSSCFIMNQVYIAHDGQVGDSATLASSVLLAGHVTLGAGANLGLGAGVHQFRSVGAGAMIGMGSVVTRDIPPYALAFGSPAVVRGANRVGLQRAGVAAETAEMVHAAYLAGDPIVLDGAELPEAVAHAFGLRREGQHG